MSIQALIQVFDEMKVVHSIRYSDSDPGKPRGLFWSLKEYHGLWKQSGNVFRWITYKTKDKGFTLFQVSALQVPGQFIYCG